MNVYYFSFVIFGFVAYLIVTDNSVAYAITLLSKILKFEYEKRKWMLLNDPRNPIVKWLIWRRSLRMAKDLAKELKK